MVKSRTVRIAALGVDGAYVIVWEDGDMSWKLWAKYDQLDAILDHLSSSASNIKVSLQLVGRTSLVPSISHSPQWLQIERVLSC